jgi:hypothetical protein
MGRAEFDATLVPLVKLPASSCLRLGKAPSGALKICYRPTICSASRHEARSSGQRSSASKIHTP